jgi:signal transduction histidine kinase/DNA-binding response OmpR family regulator
MASILRDIEGQFGGKAVPPDEFGYLDGIAAILAPAKPALLFLATADGIVKAARRLGPQIPASSVGRLAKEAAKGDDGTLRIWTALVARRRRRVFAVRLGEQADAGVLGGVLGSPSGSRAMLRRRAAALERCGRLAWRGMQQEQLVTQLQTRIRHLLSQHDTLWAAHGEVTVQAIEEHSRRLREEQQRAAMRQVCEATEAANKAKSDFLATMSHELRTPLNGVIGMTELLRATPLDARQREFAEACHTSGRALLDLINDILDFSKIEAGKLELDLYRFDLEELIETVVAMMAVPARQKGLRLSGHVATEARRRVCADRGRLRQVLVNLVGNAIKFTESGEVHLSAEAGSGTIVRFVVCDTGIGIAAERMPRLFESFSQAGSATTRTYGGTGLGLAISRNLVELMGGRIGVESAVGQGSRFWFELPLAAAGEEPCTAVNRPAATEAGAAASLALPAGRRVLLAEDNRVNQMFTQEVLRQAGVECVTAANGRQVLELFEKARFDLVLMDCQMPEMDGFEATRQIRARERAGVRAGRVPVLALTANAVKGDPERCLDAGMDAYLAKPFESAELLRAIGRLWTAARERSVGEASPAETLSAAVAPPIDFAALVRRCSGSAEFAQRLLADFESKLPECVTRIGDRVQAGDAAGTAAAAHFLKGAAGTLLAESLRASAAGIEAAGKAGDLAAAAARMGQLRDAVQRCLQFLLQRRSAGAGPETTMIRENPS